MSSPLIWSYDSVVLAAVAADLDPFVGCRIGRIVQPVRDTVVLALHPDRRQRVPQAHLLVSIHPRWARMHLSGAMDGDTSSPFCQLLRARGEGGRLRRIAQPAFERTLTFGMDTLDGEFLLIAEVMGRHSNLIAVSNGTILGALKTVTPRMSSVRPVVPGYDYAPPPQDRVSPTALTAVSLRDLLAASTGPFARRLSAGVLGIGPLLAAELMTRAGLHQAADLSPDDAAAALWPVLIDLVDTVRTRRFTPTLYRSHGVPAGFAPFPLTTLSGLVGEVVATMSAAVAAVAASAAGPADAETERTALQAAIAAALAKSARTEADLRRSLAEAAGGGELKERGELLFAYASQIPAGAADATVPGFDGRPVTIALDPTMTATDNARRLFKRYARIKSAQPQLEQRLRAVMAQREYLDSMQAMIDTAASMDDLAAIREELIEEGVLHARRRRSRAAAPRSGPRRYVTASGHEVLVGRTNLENDRVTFTLGRPDDLWFHARAVPGAHVILRTAGRDVPDEAIRDAARIAAYYSRARSGGKVPVSYTPRKYVKKPKGARPGLVTITREKTVVVEPGLPP